METKGNAIGSGGGISSSTSTTSGSYLNYLRLGANLHILEWSLIYVLPCLVRPYLRPAVWSLLVRNAAYQCILFVGVVLLPAYRYERMAYVDIGWPTGLALLGVQLLLYQDEDEDDDEVLLLPLRQYLSGGMMFLHGLRMASGAVVFLGHHTRWTFRFVSSSSSTATTTGEQPSPTPPPPPPDLARYRYARHRWVNIDGMPAHTWWIKIQHDCVQQGLANCTVLALPVVLSVTNGRQAQALQPLEILGWCTWTLAWLWENLADGQKISFDLAVMKEQQRQRQQQQRQSSPPSVTTTTTTTTIIPKNSVIGYKPYDTRPYCLWTWCRHPNYLGELGCWFGMVLVGLSSVPSATSSTAGRCLLVVLHLLLLRVFYDCLVWWTGAAPAEFFSVRKRPLYREYQRTTPCLFPTNTTWCSIVPDYRVPGWPNATTTTKQQ